MTVVALLWSWWNERNKKNHCERFLTIDEFQFTVGRHVVEWEAHLKAKQGTNFLQARSWQPPPTDFVKINVDAAFNISSNSGGWGCICRDEEAVVRFAAAGRIANASDALHAETFALLKAVEVADDLGVGRVVFETDCLVLKQALMSTSYDYSRLGYSDDD
uniref:Uncharacterized protein n=1 Tax=Avena sativa TaxID=4498 RepID=A0ACD6AT50_AVESA